MRIFLCILLDQTFAKFFTLTMMAMEDGEEWREMFGESDSENESFHGFPDVGEDSNDDKGEVRVGGGRQDDPVEGTYNYSYCLQELTEESGIRADFTNKDPSELEIFLKVFIWEHEAKQKAPRTFMGNKMG